MGFSDVLDQNELESQKCISAEAVESGNEGARNPYEALESFLKENNLEDDYTSSVVYQVYQDLRLIRRWSNVQVKKSSSRTFILGTAPALYDSVYPGRRDEEGLDRTQVIIPVPASAEFSPMELQRLCRECVHPGTGKQLRCVTLAIVDEDSTTAYYRIFDKWEELVHPQWKMMKKRKEIENVGTEERTGNEEEKDEEEVSSGNTDSDSD